MRKYIVVTEGVVREVYHVTATSEIDAGKIVRSGKVKPLASAADTQIKMIREVRDVNE